MNLHTKRSHCVTFKGGPYDGKQRMLEGCRLTLFEPVIRQMYGENRPIETVPLGHYDAAMDGYAYWVPA